MRAFSSPQCWSLHALLDCYQECAPRTNVGLQEGAVRAPAPADDPRLGGPRRVHRRPPLAPDEFGCFCCSAFNSQLASPLCLLCCLLLPSLFPSICWPACIACRALHHIAHLPLDQLCCLELIICWTKPQTVFYGRACVCWQGMSKDWQGLGGQPAAHQGHGAQATSWRAWES